MRAAMHMKSAAEALERLRTTRDSGSMRIQLPSEHAPTIISLADLQRISTAC